MSGNGDLDVSTLTPINNGMYLQHDTARAWFRMVLACHDATGVGLYVTPPDGGYRTLAYQQYELDLYRQNGSHGTSPAVPGKSTHGLGTRVDIANWSSAGKWLTTNAAEFGFRREFSDEPWHFGYFGTITAAESTTPLEEEEHEMQLEGKLLVVADGKTPYLLVTATKPPIPLADATGARLPQGVVDAIGGLFKTGTATTVTKAAYDGVVYALRSLGD